jgi:hypothetical protein
MFNIKTHQTVHANMANHLIMMDIVGQLVLQILSILAGKIKSGKHVRVHGVNHLTKMDYVKKLVTKNNSMKICLFVLVNGQSISMVLAIVWKSVNLELNIMIQKFAPAHTVIHSTIKAFV